MEKIYNKHFNETYYKKVLDNGLNVIIFDKKDYHNNFFTLITPYGSSDYRQVDDQGNIYDLPAGVAHFLEHRMFDYKGFDVMERFTELGSTSNASTGYDQTQYYFGTTKSDFSESLSLLLDYVFDLTIPKETVEKEKGIIIEELNMYDGMPDFKLYFGIIKNLYHKLPYIEDIGGSIKSVSDTTLEQLETAYKFNYHPAQMYLVGATNNDILETFDFIEANMQDKEFPEYRKMTRLEVDEPVTVNKEHECVEMDIVNQKVAVGFKFKHNLTDAMEIDKMEILLDIYLDMLFSSVNSEYQSWLDEGLINDYFDADITVDKDFGHMIFSGESDDLDKFESLIFDVFANQDKYLTDVKFEQLQKKFIGRAIMALEQPSTIAQVYGRNISQQIDVFASIEQLQNLSLNDLKDIVKKTDLIANKATYIIKPKTS